jgi:hypothetical protein
MTIELSIPCSKHGSFSLSLSDGEGWGEGFIPLSVLNSTVVGGGEAPTVVLLSFAVASERRVLDPDSTTPIRGHLHPTPPKHLHRESAAKVQPVFV